MLETADLLETEARDRPRALQFVSGLATDLVVDWCRFRGLDARPRVAELHTLLRSGGYSLEGLVALFGLKGA